MNHPVYWSKTVNQIHTALSRYQFRIRQHVYTNIISHNGWLYYFQIHWLSSWITLYIEVRLWTRFIQLFLGINSELGNMSIRTLFLTMADNITSKNIDLYSWITLYIEVRLWTRLKQLYLGINSESGIYMLVWSLFSTVTDTITSQNIFSRESLCILKSTEALFMGWYELDMV